MVVLFRRITSALGGVGRQVLGPSLVLPVSAAGRVLYRKKGGKGDQGSCPKLTYGGMKVTICGAAGATGQPLALLLKQCPLIDELAVYDTRPCCGFGVELSHVDTKPRVTSFSGRNMLCDALKDAAVVVILTREKCDTFEDNAPIITEIALQICNTCPTCFTIVCTQPVESLVPLLAEIQRLRFVYNPRKLLGCVELNCVRANTVLADFLRVPPETVKVPVIGGATPNTMVPLLSQVCHPAIMTQEQLECITSCIMDANKAVAESKGDTNASSCLAGAFAIARCTCNVVKALLGTKITQCAYVDCLGCCTPGLQFFATEVILGASGIVQHIGVPELTKFENCMLLNGLPAIRNEQAKACWLVYSMCQECCSPNCPVHASTSSEQPYVPCTPPTNWTCDCPDACRDEYLASICRKMTCKCGSTELCWRPREEKFDAERAEDTTHQMPTIGAPCRDFEPPKPVSLKRKVQENSTLVE